MVSERLKQLIFKQLYKELGKVEIIPALYSYWFIDREEKYWYFQLTNSGCLYWRYDYFRTFFTIFSLEPEDFVPIISSWVEEVLNSEVSTTFEMGWINYLVVEEVLISKVSTTFNTFFPPVEWVEEALISKVSTTEHSKYRKDPMVEEVLDIKVSKTVRDVGEGNYLVEEILNSKVFSTNRYFNPLKNQVEEILNQK